MSTVISRYALLFVIGAFVLLAATGNLFSSSVVVIAAQLLAVSIAIWARRSFPTKTFRVDATPSAETVIRRGPYRLIRHPMYSAALLFIWAAVLAHLSTWTAAIGAFVTIIAALRIVFEERFLRDRYPDYAGYAQVTKAIVPYLI
ncbi:MAG: isoprenylcysteine carboxylmethyltransferase family protein [Acidobacteriia bacterium]|nr:isoprenylcysteine carboxylmethyltransferase family protein [Terriglobia bacterium]